MKAKTSREKLIKDCLELIWSKGANGTSMSDIASKASILKGSFYNYFKSKDEFIYAVLDSYAAAWEKGVNTIFRDSTMSSKIRFQKFFDNLKQMAGSMHFTQGELVGNLALEMSGLSERFASQIETIFSRIQWYIAQGLRDAQDDGLLSKEEDTDALAEFILNSMEGAMLRSKSSKSLRPIEILETFLLQKFAVA